MVLCIRVDFHSKVQFFISLSQDILTLLFLGTQMENYQHSRKCFWKRYPRSGTLYHMVTIFLKKYGGVNVLSLSQASIINFSNQKLLLSMQFLKQKTYMHISIYTNNQEVRAVERRILLETLANQLPPGTVSFSSKLAKIEKDGTTGTLLQLLDGTQLLAKIVIGCDGIRSPVAKWMGFSEAQYVGHCAFRGLAVYPNGQPFKPRVNYVYGLRAGYVPVSPTKVYWFICFNRQSPAPKITDPTVLKKEAQELVRNWPSELLEIINKTPDDTISRTPLVDRWLWPNISPHPMTPNLGQGACCALEDSVVLARKLANVLSTTPTAVEDALKSYERERWGRIFPLTIRANVVGSLLQWGNPLVCAVRNLVVIPKLVRLGPLLEHTNFYCEPLKLEMEMPGPNRFHLSYQYIERTSKFIMGDN
ncbi:hypothetical protein ACHQM5_022600 [Ranunculus cassubicifolius]